MARVAVIVAAVCAWLSATARSDDSSAAVATPAGRSSSQASATDCVRFQSPARLPAGTPFRAVLFRGLEFRLAADWQVTVVPSDEPTLDYLWVVSPPLRTAPHRMIGAGYGLTARQSVGIERPLRFVLTRAEYEAARAAIDSQQDAGITLKELERLGRGRLTFRITDYQVRDNVTLPGGATGDVLDWIAFTGEACAPRGSTAL